MAAAQPPPLHLASPGLPCLRFAGLLGVAADNLHFVRLDRLAAVVHLERYVLDEERPHLVAEPVRVEAPLHLGHHSSASPSPTAWPAPSSTNLELQAALDVLLQRLRDRLVEVAQDLHRQLRVDALIANEVVERVRQSEPDARAARPASASLTSHPAPDASRHPSSKQQQTAGTMSLTYGLGGVGSFLIVVGLCMQGLEGTMGPTVVG
ncbi:hypothetical protein TOPH_07523 [Tolypocladium ophioglossoides CBS 100239]|uniref:Uncharacterized protein n=1 Tax=Tolypocladium ophioglossoides (strain CBS 100239) TaxID=1163406 RepID=A0A0L0N1A9_TOLOC|nr:hypothetical protein TOPH_07523 [Tolypocladium ophioglossoides CBS 100239]